MQQDANSGRHRSVSVSGGTSANRGGFDGFFRTEFVGLVRFIRRAGGTQEEAEDAASSAMAGAYRSWATLTNPGAWVRTTALRCYVHQLQRDRTGLERAALASSDALLTPAVDERDPGEPDRVLRLLRTLAASATRGDGLGCRRLRSD